MTWQPTGDVELRQLSPHDDVNNGRAKPFVPSSQGMGGRYRGTRFGAYRVTTYDKIITGVVILLNLFLLILALGALFVGIFLNTYRGSYVHLCSDNEWFVAAGCMLAVGAMLLIHVFVCFVAIYLKSSALLSIYIGVLLLFVVGEITAGVYSFVRRAYIKDRFKACMKDAYQTDYGDPAKKEVTEAWNLFQDRFDCCGVDDPLDYRSSKVNAVTPPKACGGSIEDARGKQPCFKVIEEEVLDNYFIIGGSAVGIGVVQLLCVVCSILLLQRFHSREEYE